ncbi:hypothetical protein ACQ859_20100 [Roseateles chitinivorans]|uniref:hypothetical protein n=1 Tax=Roseateles chitinivorans TaxID=2917965 RepID=UPI003D67E8FE
MRSFEDLPASWNLQRVHACRTGTLYQFNKPQDLHDPHSWGMSFVIHYNRDVDVLDWVALRERVVRIFSSDDELKRVVTFVPYAEVGTDFIVQSKPPYDGGYFLSSLHEWTTEGDTCRPPEGCESSYAELQAAVERVISALPAAERPLLEPVIRSTFTMNAGSWLQFVGDDGWVLYELEISTAHIERFLVAPLPSSSSMGP